MLGLPPLIFKKLSTMFFKFYFYNPKIVVFYHYRYHSVSKVRIIKVLLKSFNQFIVEILSTQSQLFFSNRKGTSILSRRPKKSFNKISVSHKVIELNILHQAKYSLQK